MGWLSMRGAAATAAVLSLALSTPALAGTSDPATPPSDSPLPRSAPVRAPVTGLHSVGAHEDARMLVMRATDSGPGITTIPVDGRRQAQAVADRQREEPDVVAVGVDRPMHALGGEDPLRGRQWGLDTGGVPRAWRYSTGAGTVVAVVDSGVDAGHPDLAGAVTSGYNARRDRGDHVPADRDGYGHGTHVAGIIAARAGNGIGIAGVAPRTRIVPVKVLDRNGSGWMSDVTEGIVWAVNHGVDVINLSLGGPDATFMAGAIKYAISHGVTVVAAAGNDGTSRPTYPAALPGVISVGAWSEGGPLASWSNRGSTLDVVAPGTDIWSTVPGGYESMDGTSMAAPFVAGIAALILAQDPTANVMSVLRATSRDRGVAGRDDKYGWGLVDAEAAARRACCEVASRGAPLRQEVAAVPDLRVGQVRRLPRHTDLGRRTHWSGRTDDVCTVSRHSGRSRVKGRSPGSCRLVVKAAGTAELAPLKQTVRLRVGGGG